MMPLSQSINLDAGELKLCENVVGFKVFSGNLPELSADILSTINQPDRNGTWLACFNPHSYAVSKGDPAFSNALHEATWLVPDGAGIILGAKILGLSVPSRIAGPDIFETVMNQINSIGGKRVFFLGSTTETLHRIQEETRKRYPNMTIAGTYSPPFKPSFSKEDTSNMIKAVNSANADLLWVGMTAPKQEKWIAENIRYLNVGFAGAVGAAFDFYAGSVTRSHPLFRALGLEWLPRLIRQPKRLWRRTFISAPIFLIDILRERLNTFRRS